MVNYTERLRIRKTVRSAMLCTLLYCLNLVVAPAFANEESDDDAALSFLFKPERCVTLREGQPCYVKLKVSWTSRQPISVCIFDEGEVPLACWAEVVQGEYFGSQYLYETTRYTLRDSAGVELDESTVTVAWVYKSRRARKRWRLF